MPDERQLVDLYRYHSEEVRFQVQLNWDRAKSSLTFHVAMLALIAALDKVFIRGFTAFLLLFVAASALASARILHISHGYYRQARDRRSQLEAAMGTPFSFITTPGMRHDSRRSKINITALLIVQHGLLALVAVAGAFIYLKF